MNPIDAFLKTREKYKAEMAQSNSLGKNAGNFKGNNEMDLCGDKNLGMTLGVFLSDKNGIPYRIIKGYRTFRIDKEVAKKYDIKNYELRICDPEEYINATDQEKELITRLIKKFESVEKNWEAWEGKIAKFKPTYSDTLTIQYMKVLQKLDAHNNPVSVEPGVKVLKSRSKAYYRAFDALISSNQVATGGYEFLSDLISRETRERNVKYTIQVTRSQFYNFVITSVPAKTEITDVDLAAADDLTTEVININRVDVETLNKWNKMFNDEYQAIKNGVEQGAVPPAPPAQSEPVVETKPVESVGVATTTPAEPVVADSFDDSDPFS